MAPKKKSILFLTGTRADYGKLYPLIQAVNNDPNFECRLFVTGMHTMKRYGHTVEEVKRCGVKDMQVVANQIPGEPMDLILANTTRALGRYVHEFTPDMIIVHGDRVEALAGATVGALRNIITVHIEGGELSGTIDGAIRHAVSKLAHLHFVANDDAANRLRQLGESEDSVFVIGSPDIDLMLSDTLPTLEESKDRYDIPFDDYGVVLFHPVTTEVEHTRNHARALVDAVLASGKNYVVIYPNNDEGTEEIFYAYHDLENNPKFRIFPSIRFRHFLTLLKNSKFIVGNSSAGIREAPVYGIPSIDIGTRQSERYKHESIINAEPSKAHILKAINAAMKKKVFTKSMHFGDGNSTEKFMEVIHGEKVWKTSPQKTFVDFEPKAEESKPKVVETKPHVLGLITARGGSKGIPRKNLVEIAGKPLIYYTIKAAQESKKIDRLLVSTDDKEIAKYCKKLGAEVLMRPVELAQDKSRSEDVVTHAIESSDPSPDVVVLLQPTSPLRSAKHIDEAVGLFFKEKAASIVSVCEMESHPYKTLIIESGMLMPAVSQEFLSAPRQELPICVKQNGAIYVVDTKDFTSENTFLLSPCVPYMMDGDSSLDIDTKHDLKEAEKIILAKSSSKKPATMKESA